MFQIKRYELTSTFQSIKVQSPMDFPDVLDMAPYIAASDREDTTGACRWKLFAASIQFGSLNGGHYTAYARLISSTSASSGGGTDGPWYYLHRE